MNQFSRKRVLRYAVVASAVVLLICPDPFSDLLAFWLLAKVGCDSFFRKWMPFRRTCGEVKDKPTAAIL